MVAAGYPRLGGPASARLGPTEVLALAFLDTPHSTNETGATNCYIQKTIEKEARKQTRKHRRQGMAS